MRKASQTLGGIVRGSRCTELLLRMNPNDRWGFRRHTTQLVSHKFVSICAFFQFFSSQLLVFLSLPSIAVIFSPFASALKEWGLGSSTNHQIRTHVHMSCSESWFVLFHSLWLRVEGGPVVSDGISLWGSGTKGLGGQWSTVGTERSDRV